MPASPIRYLYSASAAKRPRSDEHEDEHHQADQQPHRLLAGQVGVDAVDQQDAQRRQQGGDGQQVGIGPGNEDAVATCTRPKRPRKIGPYESDVQSSVADSRR